MASAILLLGSCGGGASRSQKSSLADPSVGSYALTFAATSGNISHGTYVTLDVQ
jgi:hypothetical protein